MKLVPSDLGSALAEPILRRRGAPQQTKPPSAVGGAIGAAVGISAALVSSGANLLVALGTGVASGSLIAFGAPRFFRKLAVETPLTPSEVEGLRERKQTTPSVLEQIAASLLGHPIQLTVPSRTLEESYLDLVSAALTAEIPDAAQEAEFRATLRSLGTSVAALPAPTPISEIEISDLVVDAEGMLFRAKREQDPVIAASLNRQAEATVRRARSLQEAAKIARRTKVLRDEVSAQVEAVRASLPLYAQAQQLVASGRLQQLAESVRSVAQEAASVSAAQEELLQALDPPITAQVVSETPQTIRQRR